MVATRENTVVQVNPQTNNGSLVPGNPTPLYLVVLIEAAIMVVVVGGGGTVSEIFPVR